MALDSFIKSNTYHFSSPRPMDNYPKDSIKKMAVLFTDIVGSSNFFKTHGDIAGRKMLKSHQDMVSPLISEFGGALVKLLGDSVMSYFLNPTEALKSAIKIQQKFQAYNEGKGAQDQIHIRICIHFGDGIVEENDIFGDVVNMAAKVLPLVDGDQIFISKEVRGHVNELPSISFAPVVIKNKKDLFEGLTIFKVIWDDTEDFAPAMQTLLLLKPVWSLGQKGLNGIWQSILKNSGGFWPSDKIKKEKVLPDKSLALIIKDGSLSLVFAKRVIEFLKSHMGDEYEHILPIQIIIDSGSYLKAGGLSLADLKVDWHLIEPGEIYVSASARKSIKAGDIFSSAPSFDRNQPQSFFKVVLNDKAKSKPPLFMYQNALIQGEYPPCFYCGDRRHLTADCPSKQITEITNSLDKLGYLPVDEINNQFFLYLNESSSDDHEEIGAMRRISGNRSSNWAHQAFYELKSIFQLRFFRTIWNLPEENWNRIKERKDNRNKGGLLWIALDCIRVSNFQQAGSIIKDALSKDPNDYKAFCLAGFLNIERNDPLQAQVYFKKSLDHAKTTPQKMLILFLLSRIYYLNREHHRAKKMLNRIMRLSPYCPEALYQDILFKFQDKNKTFGLNQLIKLIKTNRDYYIIALIDPELYNFSKSIHSSLEQLFIETREEAKRIMPEVRDESDRLAKLMGKDSKEVTDARSVLSKIEELSKTDSYFGYLDIIHYSGSTINMSHRIIEGRKMRLLKILRDLRRRIKRCLAHIETLPYPFLTKSVSYELMVLQKKVDEDADNVESHEPDEFNKFLKGFNDLSDELSRIESRLKRLDSITQVIGFAASFLKKNIFFQSANLIIGLFLFPLMIHYLNFILPEFKITPKNIWYFQKVFIILGGISGIILASLTTKADHPK